MKPFLLASILVLTAISSWGQTPAQIMVDYRTKAAAACQKLDSTLQTEGAAIAAALVGKGDTTGASKISEQIEAKVKGDPVPSPHNAISTLFIQYDAARSNTLKPIKAASIQRIEAALKTSAASKDMKLVLELAKAREEIEGGKIQTASPAAGPTPLKIPMSWTYHLNPDRQKLNGELTLSEDGSLVLGNADSKTPGKWEQTKDPNILKIILETDKGKENCEMRIAGNEAEIQRSIGTRFLKAK
jgi:hypothetical protein